MHTAQEQQECAISQGQVPGAGTSMPDAGRKKKNKLWGKCSLCYLHSVLSPQWHSLMHLSCFSFSDRCSLILLFFASKIVNSLKGEKKNIRTSWPLKDWLDCSFNVYIFQLWRRGDVSPYQRALWSFFLFTPQLRDQIWSYDSHAVIGLKDWRFQERYQIQWAWQRNCWKRQLWPVIFSGSYHQQTPLPHVKAQVLFRSRHPLLWAYNEGRLWASTAKPEEPSALLSSSSLNCAQGQNSQYTQVPQKCLRWAKR